MLPLKKQENYYRGIFDMNAKRGVSNSAELAEAFRAVWDQRLIDRQECLYLLLLDDNGKIKAHELVTKGDFGHTPVNMRLIVEFALEYDSSYIALAHNHPKSDRRPSAPDMAATKELNQLLKRLNICLVDHIILTTNNYYSFKDNLYL